MKKLSFVSIILAITILSACGSKETETEMAVEIVAPDEVVESVEVEEPVETEVLPEPEVETVEIPEPSAESDYDVDLTTLSATMVYAEVYNMMVNTPDYVGKTVKAEGVFASFYDEMSETLYTAVIIMDATACCAQGLEFVLLDTYTYPDDYPIEGEIVTVTGEFALYTPEGAPDMEFPHLIDAEILS